VILTWKLDRLARSLVHLVQTIQELDSLGVRFVAVTQKYRYQREQPDVAVHYANRLCAGIRGKVRELPSLG